MQVIHNPIDLADLDRVTKNAGISLRHDKVRLFYAGRLYYRKGIGHLLRIISTIKDKAKPMRDFELQIYGRGPLESSLKRYSAKHNLTCVNFYGHVSREHFLKSMNESDIVCFPSLWEACPLLLMEAMGLGKPVVAFDRSFSREILGRENTSLLARDERDYARKLSDLMQSKDTQIKLGLRLREKARGYDSSIAASR
jgi:glycosyltransferase involved in cell wall biosynthesis